MPGLLQLEGDLFLTDAGLDTWIRYSSGMDFGGLPSFALVGCAEGRATLVRYYAAFIDLARRYDCGLVLETPTWQANADRAAHPEFGSAELRQINRDAADLLADLRRERDTLRPVVISGSVGPRRDGYRGDVVMSAREAQDYHAVQISALAEAHVDMITGMTMTNVPESIGIARAAAQQGLPCAISFTLGTDGRLPSGQSLKSAIEEVDACAGPDYFGLNCVHPNHFLAVLAEGGDWTGRIRALRANASCKGHDILDRAQRLHDGDPNALAHHYRAVSVMLDGLAVVGGCCGTDHRHVKAIADTLMARA